MIRVMELDDSISSNIGFLVINEMKSTELRWLTC